MLPTPYGPITTGWLITLPTKATRRIPAIPRCSYRSTEMRRTVRFRFLAIQKVWSQKHGSLGEPGFASQLSLVSMDRVAVGRDATVPRRVQNRSPATWWPASDQGRLQPMHGQQRLDTVDASPSAAHLMIWIDGIATEVTATKVATKLFRPLRRRRRRAKSLSARDKAFSRSTQNPPATRSFQLPSKKTFPTASGRSCEG